MTEDLNASYKDQVSATTVYYDDLLAETTAGLDAIKESRDADMDNLELNMLLQKEAQEKAYAAGAHR